MDLTRRHLAALTAGLLAAPPSGRAQQAGGPAVVELFTSQGCSSCPPADQLIGTLASQPGTIPLSYPVEIWDYLGWRDTLAKPAFTARQRAYAMAVARKRVYTPQAIVNGRADCVGSDVSAIDRLRGPTATRARFHLVAGGDGWVATVPSGLSAARLVLVPIAARITVPIGRGENAGRTITYFNVARDLVDLGPAEEGKPAQISRRMIDSVGADGFALLLQQGTLAKPEAVLAGALVTAAGIRV